MTRIPAIHGYKAPRGERTGLASQFTEVNEDSTGPAFRHGAYVLDVRYAGFAGAKACDTATEKINS